MVRVPVLSEHNTDMQPSVSIVARFFTRTLRLAIRLATMVSDSATQTGKPYGETTLDQRPSLYAQIGGRTWGTKAVRHPIELMIAPLAVS